MKKAARIIGIVALVIVIFAAIIASINNKPSNSDKVWDARTTIGNPEAKNYFILYSDLVCPYCIAFENAIVENEEEFRQYIKDNDISKIFLCGIDTECCVLKTAFDLFEKEYDVYVLKDYCACMKGNERHNSAIEILQRNIGYDKVI